MAFSKWVSASGKGGFLLIVGVRENLWMAYDLWDVTCFWMHLV